jgi:hypothetical protein
VTNWDWNKDLCSTCTHINVSISIQTLVINLKPTIWYQIETQELDPTWHPIWLTSISVFNLISTIRLLVAMNYLVSCCHQLVQNKLFKNKMRTKVHLALGLTCALVEINFPVGYLVVIKLFTKNDLRTNRQLMISLGLTCDQVKINSPLGICVFIILLKWEVKAK